MARPLMVSGVAGMLVAGAAFVVLQAWNPPMFILEQLGASGGRRPQPEEPRHQLAVRPESAAPTTASIVTEADVVAARVRPAAPDGVTGVTLELGAAGRDRLAGHAKAYPTVVLAVAVDGAVIYTRPASALAAGPLELAAAPPLSSSANQIAARFGGAPVPVPSHLVQAARLVPALIAGFIALALVRLLTRR
jgi:hypothetical protein